MPDPQSPKTENAFQSPEPSGPDTRSPDTHHPAPAPPEPAWRTAPPPGPAPAWGPLAGTVPPQPSAFQTATPAPPLYDLRPLSTGEILDRSFSLYRRRFWLYAGLSSVAAAVTTVGTFVRLTWGFGATFGEQAGPRQLLVSAISTLVTSVFFLLAYSVTQAATVSAVGSVYLGRQTSIGQSFATVRRFWYRYLGIVLWQAWSSMWLPLLLIIPAIVFLIDVKLNLQTLGAFLLIPVFASLVYSVIAYIRNSLGIAASVGEGLTVRQSMRRSKTLVAGRKGRVFALLMLMYVLSLAAGVVQGVFAVFMTLSHQGVHILLEALTLLATFATGTLVTPVGAIAFCLLYLDERVRREGLDVEMSLERAAAGTVPPPPPPPPGSVAADPSPFSSAGPR